MEKIKVQNIPEDRLITTKKIIEISYENMKFQFEINCNPKQQPEEMKEIINSVPSKFFTLDDNNLIESKGKYYQIIIINFKNAEEIVKDEKSHDLDTIKITVAKYFINLILLILNKNPDDHHKFLFKQFLQILKNESCVSIYQKNVNNLLKNLKTFENYIGTENTQNNLKLLYYSISSIISAFIGDSMGSYVEFTKPSINNHKFIWAEKNQIFGTSRGQITDDSEMALSLILGLCDSLYSNSQIENYLAYYYGLWYASSPFDIGLTTRKAFDHFAKIYNKFDSIIFSRREEFKYYENCVEAAKSAKTSLSNGFLMRHTPLTFYNFWKFENKIIPLLDSDNQLDNEMKLKIFNEKIIYQTFSKIINLISPINEKDVSITHANYDTLFFSNFYDLMIINILYCHSKEDHGKIAISCNVYNRMINYFNYFMNNHFENSLYSSETMSNLYQFIQKVEILNSDLWENRYDLSKYKDKIEKFILSEQMGISNTGFFLHAIKLSLYFLKFYSHFDEMSKSQTSKSDPFEYFMFLVCDLGGDTDTNCCIAGGVIGALVGFNSFNEKYLRDTMNFLPSKSEVKRPVLYSPALSICMALQIFKKFKETNSEEINKNFTFKFQDLKLDSISNSFESLNVILQLFLIDLNC